MMSNSTDISRLRHALEDAYPLGEIAAIESIPTDEEEYLKDAGVTLGAEVANLRSAFRVTSSSGSYFLKRVSSWVSDEQLRRVEAFLGWSQERELLISPKLITPRAGGGHISIENARYQLFQFVEQEKRQNWMNSQVSHSDCRAAGELLTRLHSAFNDYQSFSKEIGAQSSRTSGVLSETARRWDNLVSLSEEQNTDLPKVFSKLVRDKILLAERLSKALNTASEGEMVFEGKPVDTLVHGDFHPGNVLIVSGAGRDNIANVIDFDHMHLASPVFDFGYGLVMFGQRKSDRRETIIDWDLARYFIRGVLTPPGYARPSISDLLPAHMTIACFLIIDWAADRFLNGPKPFAELYLGIVADMLHLLMSENFEKSADIYYEELKEFVG